MAIPYNNPDVLEGKRLQQILDEAGADWTEARRKFLAAQAALARAEERFDRASKALERYHNPDLFNRRR